MRLFCLCLFLLAIGLPAAAETRYSGEQTLWQDTVWSGDVIIDGILTVAPEVRLEIRPGTRVLFTPYDSNSDGLGEHELFIQGRLLALGTAEQPIRFSSTAASPWPGAWGAVNMMGSEEDNQLRFCIVEYAYRGFHAHFGKGSIEDSLFRHNLRAFQFQDSTVRVTRCRLENNFNGLQFRDATVTLDESVVSGGQWAVRCVYSTLTMTRSLVENNRMNGVSLRDSTLNASNNLVRGNRKGIYLQRSQGDIRHNRIEGNAEHGTFFEDSEVKLTENRVSGNGKAGVRWLNSGGEISDNEFSANGEYALVNDGVDDLAVGSNWWGTADEIRVAALIREQRERSEVGRVLLAAPLTRAPGVRTFAPPAAPHLK